MTLDTSPIGDSTARALLVLAHPRQDSLTARIAEHAHQILTARGHDVDVLDLHAEGFDPRMVPEDEPDWSDRDKPYSAEVRQHMARIVAADVIVVVFPVWWYSLPAVLKGWVDRVWNYGFAYGRSRPRLRGKRMLWLGLAGMSAYAYAANGMDVALDRQLRVGISNYCGIEDARVRLLFDTVAGGGAGTLSGVLAAADTALTEFISPVGAATSPTLP